MIIAKAIINFSLVDSSSIFKAIEETTKDIDRIKKVKELKKLTWNIVRDKKVLKTNIETTKVKDNVFFKVINIIYK